MWDRACPGSAARAAHGLKGAGKTQAMHLAALIRSSLGVAVLPGWLVAAELATGALQRLLPAYALPRQAVSVVFPNSRHVPRKTRVFIDFLCARLGATAD